MVATYEESETIDVTLQMASSTSNNSQDISLDELKKAVRQIVPAMTGNRLLLHRLSNVPQQSLDPEMNLLNSGTIVSALV